MTVVLWPLRRLLLAPGGPVSRDGARQDAHREISKEIYQRDQPGIVSRIADHVIGWLSDLLDRAAGAAPGGGVGLAVIVLAAAVLLVLLLWDSGPLRRGRRRTPLDEGFPTTLEPPHHRRLADEHAAAGRYAEAVRERMRAIVRELEQRGILEPRPGRTADEVATEAGGQLPALAGALRHAATVFGEVWYGGRTATAASHDALREVDLLVRDSVLTVTPAPPPQVRPVVHR